MIFVDSSAIIALASETDLFHTKAFNWQEENKDQEFIISSLIFIETTGWIRYNHGKRLAVKIGINLLSEVDIKLHRVTFDDETEAWEYFQKKDGRSLSMIDCTTVILMKRLKIRDIFTFDNNFKNLGFNTLPR